MKFTAKWIHDLKQSSALCGTTELQSEIFCIICVKFKMKLWCISAICYIEQLIYVTCRKSSFFFFFQQLYIIFNYIYKPWIQGCFSTQTCMVPSLRGIRLCWDPLAALLCKIGSLILQKVLWHLQQPVLGSPSFLSTWMQAGKCGQEIPHVKSHEVK